MRKKHPGMILKNVAWLGMVLLFWACELEDSADCLQGTGDIIRREVPVAPFQKIVVYGKVKLFITQGKDQKVVVEAGEHLFNDISTEVEGTKLSIRDLGGCGFFRTTYVPKVFVTVPELTFLENAGNRMIEGIGPLKFQTITLRSNNLVKDPKVYTNGDFRLNLISDRIIVSGDDFSNFYLSGRTGYLKASFWAGDGRLEAGELIADSVRVFHRGTNKMIVNPLQALRGEIRSTGSVLSVQKPPVVDVQRFYTGKLLFE